jgi:hypothetical protein
MLSKLLKRNLKHNFIMFIHYFLISGDLYYDVNSPGNVLPFYAEEVNAEYKFDCLSTNYGKHNLNLYIWTCFWVGWREKEEPFVWRGCCFLLPMLVRVQQRVVTSNFVKEAILM